MAALRAVTMHTRMPSRSSHRKGTRGSARALADHAIAAAKSANGNANNVWLKRMSSSKRSSIVDSGEWRVDSGEWAVASE